MPTIKFTRDTLPHEGTQHKKGDTLECSDASAERWAKRNAAAVVVAKAIEAPPADKAIASPRKKKSKKPAE